MRKEKRGQKPENEMQKTKHTSGKKKIKIKQRIQSFRLKKERSKKNLQQPKEKINISNTIIEKEQKEKSLSLH